MNIFKRFWLFITGRGFKAAKKDRLYGNWITKTSTPNENINQLSVLRARANDLYINNPFIAGAVNNLVNKIVGYGTTLQARTDKSDLNTQIEAAWNRWCETADFYGQFHFGDIERTLIQKLFLDGGIFVKVVLDNRRKNPFCLELIEYSRLADYVYKGAGNNQVIHGVEIDKNGLVVAYHFAKNDLDNGINNTVRVSATNIIHFSPFRRPLQLLGVPLLAPALVYAKNLDDIIEAELVAKKVEASLSVFVKSNDYGRLQALNENEHGEKELEIAPGVINFLDAGEDIQILDPHRPGRSFKDFTYFILEGIARSIGMSLEQITGDKSQVNYSSARHSELELRDAVKPFRKALERYFLKPVYVNFLNYAVGSGVLNIKDFFSKKEFYEKHTWIFKGDDWVDPLKEIKAKEEEVKLGVTTLSEICAAKGKDWQEVIKQRQREVKLLNKSGLLDITQEGN